MSVSALVIRSAVDARPPAEPWFAGSVPLQLVPPDQPPLGLREDSEPETLMAAPAPSRISITVDVVPAGVDAERAAELGEQARSWAPWFAQLLVEALDGRRPLESLGRWLDDWVLAEVSRRIRLERRARTRMPSAPPRMPATVVSLRTQLSGPGVLEVAAHLWRGPRSSALAFRLNRRGQRWRCTALDAG